MSCLVISKKIRSAILSATLLLFAVSLSAQIRGVLNGKVTSASGAPVPNASITVTNTGTNETHTGISKDDGSFTIPDLSPGTYRVDVEASGFKRTSQQDVRIDPGSPVRLQVTMQAGSASETVEVAAEASLIQDDSAQVSRQYNTRFVREVPLQERNHQLIPEFMTGVTPPQPSIPSAGSGTTGSPAQLQDQLNQSLLTDPQRNFYWQTNGQQYWTNRQTLDGAENDEPFKNATAHLAPLEAIEQVNLITSNYDASQGRAAGSIVNLVTRSGTNSFHGSLFEFNSNSAFNARNYFDAKPFAQSSYNFNQYGGTIGGPIVKDHTFFFLSYEGDYFHQHTPEVTTVPTSALRSGDFSNVPNVTIYNPQTGAGNAANRLAFPGNIIPASLISPQARALMSYFPAANLPGFENNYFANVPWRDDGHRIDAKLDHRFNDHASAFVRYGYSNYRALTGSPLGEVIGTDSLANLRSHTATIGLNGTVRGMQGELRLNYIRYDDPIRQYSALTPASQFGFTNPNAAGAPLPSVGIQGMSAIGTPANYQQPNTESSWNIASHWNAHWRGNDLRFGVDLWEVRFDGFQNYNFGSQGGYSFTPGPTSLLGGAGLGSFGGFANSFASFLLGAPSQIGLTIPNYTPSNYQYQVSGYLADTVHLFDRLTIDLGVRYDFFTPLQPRVASSTYSYNPYTNALNQLGTNGVDVRNNAQYNTTNLSPRIGFAYRFGDRTAIRAGYGISYFNNPIQLQAASLIPSQTGYELGVNSGFGVAGPFGALPAASAISSNAALNRSFSYTNGKMSTPYVQTFNIQVQHDFGSGFVADVGYVGNLGRQLPYTLELNAAQPGAGVAGLPFYPHTANVLERTTGLTSNYNALQVNLTKRFSKGLSFTAAYTYSKALDYGGGLNPLINNLSVRQNYGPADFDRTHVFTLTHVWQLPIGTGTNHFNSGVLGHVLGPWQLDGVLRYSTGAPFTPTADPTLCNCPGNTPVANLSYAGTSTGVVLSPGFFGYFPYFFQVTNYALTQPAAGQLGNAGRNILRGEDLVNYDLALFRSFVFLENTKLEFRAQAYNIANSPHFANPITNVNSANFGQYTSTLPFAGARTLQLGLRLTF